MTLVVHVPNVIGMRATDARKTLELEGYRPVIRGDRSGQALVVAQVPAADVEIRRYWIRSREPGKWVAIGARVELEAQHPRSLYVDRLPNILAKDELLVAFVRGFEDIGTHLYDFADEFPRMFDPSVAGPEISRWMAGWIGLTIDGALPDRRCRALAVTAMRNFGARGTVHELEALLAAATGGSCQVAEPGGVERGPDLNAERAAEGPNEPLRPAVATITLQTLGGVPKSRLSALVESALPAWLPYRFIIGDEARSSSAEVTHA